MKKIKLLACFFISMSAFFANATEVSGHEGGAGDAVIHSATGEVVSIADPLAFEFTQGKRIKFSKEVKAELLKIKRHAEGYFFSSDVFETLTSEDSVIYLIVDELPTHQVCNERIKYNNTLGNEFNILPAACTAGKRTWIKKSIYDQLIKRSSMRELGLLLVHEGLRRVPGLLNGDLAAITNGLRETLDLYDRQVIGNMNVVTDEQKQLITEMLESILLNSLSDKNIKQAKDTLDNFDVSDFGGLLAKNVAIEEGAFVGAGSLIYPEINVGKRAVLLGTIYSVLDSKLFDDRKSFAVKIPENVRISNSRVKTLDSSFKDSLIENSELSIMGS
jgi:hypothetical protein